jgi:uncharacterized protein YjbJ (UPF0337 family)
MIVKMFILLYSRSIMIARRARSPYVSAAIKLLASFRHRWLGSTEASKYKSFLSPPPISPIAAPSEEQKDHQDNKNEIHSFLQDFWREISLLHMWVQNNYSPASDSTYYYFNGGGNEAKYFPSLPQPPSSRYSGVDTRNLCPRYEYVVMDKDLIAGAAKEIKGSVKETIGKAVGDAKLQSDGKADKVEGKVQNAIGGLKDALKK